MRINKDIKRISSIVSFIMILIMLASTTIILNAEGETLSEEVQQSTDITENIEDPTEVVHELENCICGRPYYMVDGDNYKKFDCTKCKKNIYLCTCKCWCGSETSIVSVNKLPSKICMRCEKDCNECICGDKAVALQRENDIRSGVMSTIGLSKPTNIVPLLISVLLIFALIVMIVILFIINGFTFKQKRKNDLRAFSKSARENTGFDTDRYLMKEKTAIAVYVEHLRNINLLKTTDDISYKKEKISLNKKDLAMLLYLADLKNENKAIPIEPKRERPDRLYHAGFVKMAEEDISITEKGKIISELIFRPDRIIELKNQYSSSYCFCLKGAYGSVIEQYGDLFNIYIGQDIDDFIEFTKEKLIFKSGNKRYFNYAGSFTYEEWLILILALIGRKVSFTIDDISNTEKKNYLFDNYPDIYLENDEIDPDHLLGSDNVELLLKSLISKKILTEDGGYYSLTSLGNAFNFKNINDIFYLYKNEKKASFLTALFKNNQSNEKYITLIVDSGNKINYCITNDIEWEKFIK